MYYTPLTPGQAPTLGTSGNAVTEYQKQLNQQNAGKPGWTPLSVDGLYGPKTQAASTWKPPKSASSTQARQEVGAMISNINAAQQVKNPNQEKPNQRQNINDALASMLEEDTNAFGEFQRSLRTYKNGAINLSPDEERLLGNIEERYDILKRRQMVANQSLEGGVETMQATTGLAQYAPEMADIEINRIQNEGIERLREIDMEMDTRLSEARQAILDGRVDAITESYKAYTERLKDRRDTLNLMRQNLNDYESYMNSSMTSDMKEYRLAQEQGFRGTFQQWKQSGRVGAGSGGGKPLSSIDIQRYKELYPEISEQIRPGMTLNEVNALFENVQDDEIQENTSNITIDNFWGKEVPRIRLKRFAINSGIITESVANTLSRSEIKERIDNEIKNLAAMGYTEEQIAGILES